MSTQSLERGSSHPPKTVEEIIAELDGFRTLRELKEFNGPLTPEEKAVVDAAMAEADKLFPATSKS